MPPGPDIGAKPAMPQTARAGASHAMASMVVLTHTNRPGSACIHTVQRRALKTLQNGLKTAIKGPISHRCTHTLASIASYFCAPNSLALHRA